MALKPTPTGLGKVCRCDTPDIPLPLLLERLWVRVRPASSHFILGNKKKSAGARSSEYGECSISLMCLATIQSITLAAV
jgi:hypothetical protein